MKFRRQIRIRRAGFTLLESLVVMLTIIMLASVVIPGLMGKGKKPPLVPKVPNPKKIERPAEPLNLPVGDPVGEPAKGTPASPEGPVAAEG